MDPGEPIERLSPACRQCLCPTFWPLRSPHSSHQVSRLCHPESRPVRRQRTWKRFTKQTPTDPPGATRKFYSADRGSCPWRMEGSDASTRRCRPMPSPHPGSPPNRHHLGLPSSGPGDRPTIHRLVGLRPFSVSNIAQSPHGVGCPPARWLSQLALPAGAQPAVGHHPLRIIPCRSRRSRADPLGPPTSTPPCHHHAACSKPRGPARRRCTALVRLVRESAILLHF